jgi:hypothetical protein
VASPRTRRTRRGLPAAFRFPAALLLVLAAGAAALWLHAWQPARTTARHVPAVPAHMVATPGGGTQLVPAQPARTVTTKHPYTPWWRDPLALAIAVAGLGLGGELAFPRRRDS